MTDDKDYIIREDAYMALTGDITDCTIEEFISRLRDKLSKLPSVQPKTGHWIKDTYQSAHCSNCGQIQRTNGQDTTKNCNIHYALYPYCPKCGAKMEKNVGTLLQTEMKNGDMMFYEEGE